jgi:hypothetical protein
MFRSLLLCICVVLLAIALFFPFLRDVVVNLTLQERSHVPASWVET